jgi:hypothetical protein
MKQNLKRIRLNIASFISVVILSFAGFLALSQKSATAQSFESYNQTTTRFSLSADQCWVGTGLYVYGSDAVHIQAYGEWSNGGDNPQFVDADGFRDYSHPGQVVDWANFAGLIARLGENGKPFPIGTTGVAFVFSGSGEGQLYLSINDVPGTCDDNIGALDTWLTPGIMAPAR